MEKFGGIIPCAGIVALFLINAARADVQTLSSGTMEAPDVVPVVKTGGRQGWQWGAEVKRQYTDHATPQESSRTTWRLEAVPPDYLSLIRLDIPFVDKHNGDAFEPQLGDLKTKFVSTQFSWAGVNWDGVLELVFPSGEPESVGNGKYQLGPGFECIVPLLKPAPDSPGSWSLRFKPWLSQVDSVAGYAEYRDLNYTKLELEWKAVWNNTLAFSLTPKTVYDWEQDKSGAVLELETDWYINHSWYLELVLGHGLWENSVPTGYESKIEVSAHVNF